MNRSSTLRLAWGAIALLISVESSEAQGIRQFPPAAPHTLTGSILAPKQGRIRVRVGQDSGPFWIEAHERHIAGDELVIDSPGPPASSPVPLDRIIAVQHRGSAAGTGALVGGILGGAGGCALGIALANFCIFSCESPTSGEIVRAALGGAVIFGGAGALAGAAIGSSFRRWKTVYRVDPEMKAVGVTARF